MVTIHRQYGLRVVIFIDDHEPAHVHIFGDGQVKINLAGEDGKPELVSSAAEATIADGIAVRRAGDLTLPLVSRYVDEIVTVDDEEIASAILMLLEQEKTLAEGAGAAALEAPGRTGPRRAHDPAATRGGGAGRRGYRLPMPDSEEKLDEPTAIERLKDAIEPTGRDGRPSCAVLEGVRSEGSCGRCHTRPGSLTKSVRTPRFLAPSVWIRGLP